MSSIFPVWHIALAATVAFITSLITLLLLRLRSKDFSIFESILVALVVGLTLLAWRLASNVALFNTDPIPGVSPSDALCPIVVYTFLSMYAAFRQPPAHWAQMQVALTLLTFFVSVIVL